MVLWEKQMGSHNYLVLRQNLILKHIIKFKPKLFTS
jgi:predicted glycosyltransferase